jgi:hypothetical protein
MRNKEEKILLEIQKMRNMMGLNPTNNLIFEQGSADITDMRRAETQLRRAETQLSGTQDEKSNYFSEKKTFNIGEGTNYPFIYYKGIEQFDTLPVVEGTKVFLIKKGMTSKDFIPKAKVGTVIDDLGKEHPNQEYIEEQIPVKDSTGKQIKKTIKLCLPDKSFWDLPEHIGKVYKFVTPSSSEGGMFSAIESFNTTFAMTLEQKGTTFSDATDKGETTQQTGYNAAIRCRGGDNGWGWSNPAKNAVLFVDPKTGEFYNPKNPRMLDTRSDWKVWYDHYGTWLEIGIGVAASFIGAGLATLILRVAKAAKAAGQITASLLAVLETSYGTSTALSVILQVLTEGVMMGPIIKWQIYDDNDADGLLSAIFLFIPFVSELKGVAKFISGPYTKEAAKTLAEKIQKEGIELIFKSGIDNPQAQAKFAKFISSLTGTELALWNRGMKIVGSKEGMESLKKTMEELVMTGGKFGKEFAEAQVKGNTETVLGKLGNVIGRENATKWANDASRFIGKNINPITAKWVLPHQFIRMGIPLTVFAMAFKYAYNELTPEEKVKFEDNFEKALLEDKSYFEALNKIDPYLAQAIVNKRIELLTSDIDTCKKFALDPEFLNTTEGKKIKDRATAEVIEETKSRLKATLIKNISPNLTFVTNILTLLALHRALLEKLKFTNVTFNFQTEDQINNLPGTAIFDNVTYNIRIKKEGDIYEYYINEIKITDEEIQNEKWNGVTTKIETSTSVKYCCLSTTGKFQDCNKTEFDLLSDNEKQEININSTCDTLTKK